MISAMNKRQVQWKMCCIVQCGEWSIIINVKLSRCHTAKTTALTTTDELKTQNWSPSLRWSWQVHPSNEGWHWTSVLKECYPVSVYWRDHLVHQCLTGVVSPPHASPTTIVRQSVWKIIKRSMQQMHRKNPVFNDDYCMLWWVTSSDNMSNCQEQTLLDKLHHHYVKSMDLQRSSWSAT